MNKLKYIIILILAITSFTSCVTEYKCSKRFPPTESKKVVITYTDTTLFVTSKAELHILADTTVIDTTINIINNTIKELNLERETQFAKAKLHIKYNKVNFTLIQKDSVINKIINDSITAKLKNVSSVEIKVKTKYIEHWYSKITLIVTIIDIIIIIVIIILIAAKIYTIKIL